MLVSLSFKRLAQVGEVNIIHSNFGKTYFISKRKTLIESIGFKPIAYKETSNRYEKNSHLKSSLNPIPINRRVSCNCVKGCPTVVLLQIVIYFSPLWTNSKPI